MKIVIDARMYGLEHAGIGRYVLNLIRSVKVSKCPAKRAGRQSVKDWEFYLLVRKNKFKEIKKEVGDKFKLIIVDVPHYSFKEQIILPIQLFKLRPDLVHFPHFNVPILWWGRQVVTIHDLIKHQSRGAETTTRWPLLYWFKYLNYRFLVWLAVKRAAKIIVPSQWWKRELTERYKLLKDKIVVTYEGVDKKLKVKSSKLKVKKQEAQRVLEKYGVKKPFVIYTGSLYPHKNVERLVRAVALLGKWTKDTCEVSRRMSRTPRRRTELNLVVVCSRNVFYQRFRKKIREMKADKFVNLAGFVPDEELIVLYCQAKAFVLPSLLEGFGLIGLEAMACGCPVVSSNASCLPEIYGDAALYFDPLDVEDMAEKIRRIIDDGELRKKLKKLGLERAERYSWQKTAEETLTVYFNVLS